MLQKFIFCVFIFSVCSCNLKKGKPAVITSSPSECIPYTIHCIDSLPAGHPFLDFISVCGDVHYLEWGNGTYCNFGALDTLTDFQMYNWWPTVAWYNKEYICVMTSCTMNQSQHLFLPLQEGLPIRFIKEKYKYSDSLYNFVCYIHDSINFEKGIVDWTIIDLITGYKKDFITHIGEGSYEFPWVRNIARKGKYLWVESQCLDEGTIKIPITEFCKHPVSP